MSYPIRRGAAWRRSAPAGCSASARGVLFCLRTHAKLRSRSVPIPARHAGAERPLAMPADFPQPLPRPMMTDTPAPPRDALLPFPEGIDGETAVQALRHSEAYFRALVENARDVIHVINEDRT